MSQNRRSDNDPPHRSDSEEEEEGSSEESEDIEGSDSESEEEEQEQAKIPSAKPQIVIKKPSITKKPEPIQTPSKPQSSSSTEESGSESESDTPLDIRRKADPNIKPIASKPMDELNTATKKPRSKPNVKAPSSPPPGSSAAGAKKQPVSKVSGAATAKSVTGAKRAAESEVKESKRLKKKVDADNGDSEKKTTASPDSKKQLFQRLWSDEDELVILKGIMDYTAKTGLDPITDMNKFYGLIQKSLHVDVSKAQLLDKVRRLKKKYENNAKKLKNGKERTFSKAHDQKAYDLSKMIWGSEKNGAIVDNSKVNGTAKKNSVKSNVSIVTEGASSPKVDIVPVADGMNEATDMEVEVEPNVGRKVQFGKNIGNPSLSLEEQIISDGFELVSGPKRVEMEEKWRKLRVQEIEVYLKRNELIREQAELVLESLK